MNRKLLEQKICYHYSDSNKDIVHIGYGIDSNYMRGTMTSIVSFCLNNKERKLIFHIVTCNLLEENRLRFKAIAQKYNIDINIYNIDINEFKNFPTLEDFNLPVSMYFRFALPLILKNVNKILYIDGDIICLKNASELFDLDLDDKVAAVVPDLNGANYLLKDNKDVYFNSGMLFMDIQKWNRLNLFTKIRDFLINEKNNNLPDQNALNFVLKGKVKYIDCKFNCFIDYRNSTRDIDNDEIILLHFSSIPKPWSVGWSISKFANDFNLNLYNYYEEKTPWKGIALYKPKTYHEISIYMKSLYRNKEYLKSFIWFTRWFMKRIKSL